MTNNIENLIPRIVSRGLLSLREKAIFPRLVNAEFGAEAAKRGDQINVPLSQQITAQDVQPSATPPSPADTDMQHVTISLDHWQKAAFHLTDKEMDQIEANESFIPLQMAEAIGALARAVNQSVIDVMHEAPASAGAFMRPTFARITSDSDKLEAHEGLQPALDARRLLNGVYAPKTGRSVVLNYDAEARFLGQSNGIDASKSGETAFGIEGEIGRRLGFDFYATDNLEKNGEMPFYGTLDADINKGATSIAVSSDAAKFNDVSHLTIAGDEDNSYRVTEQAGTAAQRTITFTPGVDKPIKKGVYVSEEGGLTTGFAFHRDAVALAMRPLATTGMVVGHNGQMMTITDPESGLSLRLEVTRQYKQTVWEFDILWGVGLVKPDYVVRITGRP